MNNYVHIDLHTALPILLAVSIGGAAGGVSRYLLSVLPHGTHLANMTACAILGAATAIAPTSMIAAIITTGFAGALSTWSTLAKELGTHLKQSRRRAFTHCVLAVGTGLALYALGHSLAALML